MEEHPGKQELERVRNRMKLEQESRQRNQRNVERLTLDKWKTQSRLKTQSIKSSPSDEGVCAGKENLRRLANKTMLRNFHAKVSKKWDTLKEEE